jgi:hypothetical protein
VKIQFGQNTKKWVGGGRDGNAARKGGPASPTIDRRQKMTKMPGHYEDVPDGDHEICWG